MVDLKIIKSIKLQEPFSMQFIFYCNNSQIKKKRMKNDLKTCRTNGRGKDEIFLYDDLRLRDLCKGFLHQNYISILLHYMI